MQETENTAELLGRVAMSVIFIHGGWGKLLAPVATQAMLASHHLPMVSNYFPAQKAVFGRPCNESGRADPPAGRRRQVVK